MFNMSLVKPQTQQVCFKINSQMSDSYFSAKGSHTSSFNDGTKPKNSGSTLNATTSIIFSAVVVAVTSVFFHD